MNRSAKVTASLLAAAALTITIGCGKPEMQRCVDKDNIVVDNDLCSAQGEQRILGEHPATAGQYRYYYGGSGSMEAGTPATGGSFAPIEGHTYSTISTQRAAFGRSWPGIVIAGIVGAAVLFWRRRISRDPSAH
jgi:hypothetical protein